jgi:hypothetical protein
MRKVIPVAVLVLSLVIASGCASLKKKPAPSAGVEHKKVDVSFVGYKTTVSVKASPAEIEKYMLNVTNLSARVGSHNFQVTSSKPLAKVGDAAEFRDTIMGVASTGKFILAHYRPGVEVLYLSQIGGNHISLMRMEYSPIGDSTRVTIKYELERPRSFKTKLGDLVNVQNEMAKLIDHEIVAIQIKFDPSLRTEDLLAKGRLGEFYDAFLSGEEVSVFINCDPDKAARFLADPGTWRRWKEQSGYDFGQCLAGGQPGPCPVNMRVQGEDLKIASFGGQFSAGKYSTAYWVYPPAVMGLEVSLAPEQGATRMTARYLIDAPLDAAGASSGLMMTIMAVPQAIEQFMLGVKKDLE